MLSYPNFDPTIVTLGPIHIRWYGVMYIIGFMASYLLVRHQIRKKQFGIPLGMINDLFLYLVLGLMVGARIGYCIAYNLSFYLNYPLKVFAIWEGGMSFHGGLAGVVIAGLIFVRRHGFSFWQFADLIVVTVPIGLGLGRLGNFINGELYGRVSTLPWAMVFPSAGDLPRHPSQLYECLLEGVLLFMILWWVKDRHLRKGTLFCLFLFLYSSIRFFVEFFREPDPQLGLLFSFVTMGQILSIIEGICGMILWYLRPKHELTTPSPPTPC
jgi:phosphatidylglycerol:prolipoprotein diacylglycerol transferase